MLFRDNLDVCLAFRDSWWETNVSRALYRLSLVLKDQGQHQRAEDLLQQALALKEKLIPAELEGIIDIEDNEVTFDQMVSCWSGRYSGRQNIRWQQRQEKKHNWTRVLSILEYCLFYFLAVIVVLLGLIFSRIR